MTPQCIGLNDRQNTGSEFAFRDTTKSTNNIKKSFN